jgi:hypothetical protein
VHLNLALREDVRTHSCTNGVTQTVGVRSQTVKRTARTVKKCTPFTVLALTQSKSPLMSKTTTKDGTILMKPSKRHLTRMIKTITKLKKKPQADSIGEQSPEAGEVSFQQVDTSSLEET